MLITENLMRKKLEHHEGGLASLKEYAFNSRSCREVATARNKKDTNKTNFATI